MMKMFLRDFSTDYGVDEGFFDFGVVHMEIASEDVPQNLFEGENTSAADRPSDEPRAYRYAGRASRRLSKSQQDGRRL
jgi:hypothetical protein